MKYLRQTDPVRSAKRLGGTSYLMGRWGCTTCCVSMVGDWFGEYIAPEQLASHANLYNKDGRIIWSQLNVIFKHMEWVWRQYGASGPGFISAISAATYAKIDAAIKDPNTAVILEVNNGSHWVVAARKTAWGNDYVVIDPLTGGKVYAKQRYHNITGAAFFKRKEKKS